MIQLKELLYNWAILKLKLTDQITQNLMVLRNDLFFAFCRCKINSDWKEHKEEKVFRADNFKIISLSSLSLRGEDMSNKHKSCVIYTFECCCSNCYIGQT